MERTKTISKTMMSYLKRAREHREFLAKETQEFERGKRHLANIMGIDPGQMNQNNINHAIKYLFPSGLFDTRARPMMKHPDLLYQTKKEAQFDEAGRPFHHLYYTTLPNYYESLGNITDSYNKANQIEDINLAKGILDAPDGAQYSISGKKWLNFEDVQAKLLEGIKEHEYEYLIKCMNRLQSHPYSNVAKDLLDSYSETLPGQAINLQLPEILKNEENGEIYTVQSIRRRDHVIDVKTVLNGSGKININGTHDILFFKPIYMRRAIIFPLTLTNMLDKVDIYANITHQPKTLGSGVIASAIRYAVSLSIAAHRDAETRERLRLAGLLTNDVRQKERKKFGQEGARRKYTWKKR